MSSSDLTFITNQAGVSLKDRFRTLIKDAKFFDVLVGYFYVSGFHELYPEIETAKKIRILIGIGTDKQTNQLIQQADLREKIQSHEKVQEKAGENLKFEMDNSQNTSEVEKGVLKFIDWISEGRLEIRGYQAQIHSKLYITTFSQKDRDLGRVITGSSNFSKSGLKHNLEFNVELKNASDYEYAKAEFEKLWRDSIPLTEKYVETLKTETWIRPDISPHEIYLKFLYEYFRQDLNENDLRQAGDRPEGFKEFEYQKHAIANAKKILEQFGGVFLSDVVGLGKTIMGTMLCQQLQEKILVLAPPHLIDENNKGSWRKTFEDFGFKAKDYQCHSTGSLDKVIERADLQTFGVVLVDEAHRFKNDNTTTYENLARICRGKKVILVTATPYNNSPQDLLAQIKLFQKPLQSTLPKLTNLESFFARLRKNLKGLDRQKDSKKYLAVTKNNAEEIREKVLKYLMVRRTRREIQNYYKEDLEKQRTAFPKVKDPKPIYYQFNQKENEIFTKTLEIIDKQLSYARYTPLLFLKNDSKFKNVLQSQKNMRGFIKMLLLKRLESSFFAFKGSIKRFIILHEKYLRHLDNGKVYVTKNINKVLEYIQHGKEAEIEKLIAKGKVTIYSSNDFKPDFREKIQADYKTLREIDNLWKGVTRDPKIIAFKAKIRQELPLKAGKSIVFTESEETAAYLKKELEKDGTVSHKVIYFSGKSSAAEREKVLANFDAKASKIKNDYNLLITTDVLAEGANLHQANAVINYDIPWNPACIMQRVGRINRIDTKHKEIHTYTFFPTVEANDEIKLKELAQAKIQAFISLLGTDAKLLTEHEQPEAHSLFSQILSKDSIDGEAEQSESELAYLQEIRKVRDQQPELFEKIKKLPQKARTGRKSPRDRAELLTYFRKGLLQKFFYLSENPEPRELDFIEAAQKLKADPNEKPVKVPAHFFAMLKENLFSLKKIDRTKSQYDKQTDLSGNARTILNMLKSETIENFQGFDDEAKKFTQDLELALRKGNLPKPTLSKLNQAIRQPELLKDPLKLISTISNNVPKEFLKDTDSKTPATESQEIILSQYFRPNK